MTQPPYYPLALVREEQHFLLVHKPSGLFSQAAPGIPSVETELSELIRSRDGHPGRPFIGLPHRLDRATSGVMLVARNQRALKRFGQQFQSRKVNKLYLAVVCCRPACQLEPPSPQLLEDFLRKVPDEPRAEICQAQDAGAKLARMEIEPLAQAGATRLYLVRLLTGRMHQIRLQFASRGCPVLGDTLYGGPVWEQPQATTHDGEALSAEAGRHAPIALHALRIEFHHPKTGHLTSGTAPLPESWTHALAAPLQTAASELVLASERKVNESLRGS